MPRSISTASISFGLVTIPVRIYPAITESAGISFHLLHRKDGMRLRQQYVCPADGQVVPRSEMVRGYEKSKDRYITFTDEELKALDERISDGIEIAEFVPQDSVDPAYFDRAYYLGPDKGGDKAYALLAEAMRQAKLVAIARHAARGKDYLVLLEAVDGRLVMQQLHHSDEIRPLSDVPAPARSVKDAEVKLARQLMDQITSKRFDPSRYEDQVRQRVRKAIAQKDKGTENVAATPRRPRAEVVDLMEALKASLGRKAGGGRARTAAPATRHGACFERGRRFRWAIH